MWEIATNKDEYLNLRRELKYDPEKWSEDLVYTKWYFNTLLLFLTWACNLSCTGCFNIHQLWANFQMDLEYIKKIVENNSKIDKYDIMGWEPMIHPHFHQIISYLESQWKKIWLYTNGYLLKNLRPDYKNLRVNIAFHSLFSKNRNDKPLSSMISQVQRVSEIYPVKVVFLLTRSNQHLLDEFVEYVEKNLNIKNLTIGTIRDESDYYNDNADDILPIDEYVRIVEHFLATYSWKMGIDIFTEWVLHTKNLPRAEKNQLNRFRCLYSNWNMATCLYDVGANKFTKFDIEKEIDFPECSKCPKTNLQNCLTDKIKLRQK